VSGETGDEVAGTPERGSAIEIGIEWGAGRRVTARWEGPGGAGRTGILLAPGAGAGQGHPFLVGLRRRLAAGGYPTMTFDYPYGAEGRRVPDRLETLLACHRAAADALAERAARVVLAGKSMGSRVAGHLAAEGYSCRAVVCYGYPLRPPGGAGPRDTGHLDRVTAPILFLVGSRDPLCPLDWLDPVVKRLSHATLRVMEGGDHSFGLRASLDDGGRGALDRLAAWTVEWLDAVEKADEG
jgi:predicted alpha/beta-hydrolase family hydrolase